MSNIKAKSDIEQGAFIKTTDRDMEAKKAEWDFGGFTYRLIEILILIRQTNKLKNQID